MLKVGLVGAGGISHVHVPGWQRIPEARLVAICDIRPEMLDQYPGVRHYTDYQEMLENESLDVVDICTPTPYHVDFAVMAMERGINVISEKPISLKKEEAARAFETARKNNVKFMVAQCVRFSPAYLKIKEYYENGRYGKLLSGKMYRLSSIPKWSWDNWMQDEKRSGLTPYDLHIHDLDFVVYAFGRPNNQTTFRSRQTDQDYMMAVYEFDDFFISIDASWYAAPYDFSSGFLFQFEKAVVVLDHNQLTVRQTDGQILNFSAELDPSDPLYLPQDDFYYREIRYFTDCILNDRPQQIVQENELKAVIELLNAF